MSQLDIRWWLEVSNGGCIYTMEIGEYYKLGSYLHSPLLVKHLPARHRPSFYTNQVRSSLLVLSVLSEIGGFSGGFLFLFLFCFV